MATSPATVSHRGLFTGTSADSLSSVEYGDRGICFPSLSVTVPSFYTINSFVLHVLCSHQAANRCCNRAKFESSDPFITSLTESV
jgi:hypothetical protein